MRYGGTFLENLISANERNDHGMQHDLIVDQLADLISDHPDKVISALEESGVTVPKKASKRSLVSLVTKNLYSNPKFVEEASSLVGQFGVMESQTDYSNAIGAAIAAAVAAVTQAVGSMVSGAQQKKIAQSQLQAQEEATKRAILERVFEKKKTNWVPIVVIGGVLVIGGIILYTTLKSKNTQ